MALINLEIRSIDSADAGGYAMVVTNSFGTVTSVVAQVVIHCVDQASTSPLPPYANWATAATNIQHAIDFASPGAQDVDQRSCLVAPLI